MKTPMTFQEWADSHRVPHELRAVVSDAWYAGQANAPQPTWRRWEDEKPSVGNNVGAIMVVLEFTEETGERLDCYSITVATNYPWHLPPLAWQYILPSGFAPKQKDEAEELWQVVLSVEPEKGKDLIRAAKARWEAEARGERGI